MNGRAHLLSALFLLGPVVLAFNQRGELSALQTILLALGVLLGVAAPDVDAGKNGLGLKSLGIYGKRTVLAQAIAAVSEMLGVVFTTISRWFFYEPLTLFLHLAGHRNVARHRGVMHSLFAAMACTAFWLLVLLAGSLVAGLGAKNAFLVGGGLLAGFLFHLYCDSLTPHGVNWLFPRQFVLRGKIITGGELYGGGVKFRESQLFALAVFALAGVALLWLLLETNASAGFIAFLAAFASLVAAGFLGMEVSVEELGGWNLGKNYYD